VFLHEKGQSIAGITGKYGSKLLFISSNYGENETSIMRAEQHMVYVKEAKFLDLDWRRWVHFVIPKVGFRIGIFLPNKKPGL
jgi:hypothetical protein